jgi:hypothetical protein
MLVGSSLLTACDDALCDTPNASITKIESTIGVQTTFSFTEDVFVAYKDTFSGYPVLNSEVRNVYGTRLGSLGSGYSPFGGSVQTYVANSITNINVIWTRGVDTTANGFAGKYLRPGTDVVIANNIQWRARVCNFAYSSHTASHVEPEYSYEEHPRTSVCNEDLGAQLFSIIQTGDVVSRTPSSLFGTPKVTWLGVSKFAVPGFSIVLTSAGSALAPWIASVESGVVKLTDKNNNTTTFSGTIPSVISSINSWPSSGGKYFDASNGNATSVAETSDLKPCQSAPLSRLFPCYFSFPIVDVGEQLTPSSTDSGLFGLTFDPALYSDDEAGFLVYMSTLWYPKNNSYRDISAGSPYPPFFMSSEFDSQAITFNSLNWSKTPGPSTQSDFYSTGDFSEQTDAYTLIRYGCADFDHPIGPCYAINGEDISCNTQSFLYPFDCSGNPYPPCPTYQCWCENLTTTVISLPSTDIPSVQTMTGSLRIT